MAAAAASQLAHGGATVASRRLGDLAEIGTSISRLGRKPSTIRLREYSRRLRGSGRNRRPAIPFAEYAGDRQGDELAEGDRRALRIAYPAIHPCEWRGPAIRANPLGIGEYALTGMAQRKSRRGVRRTRG